MVYRKETTEPQCKLVKFEYTEMESWKYEKLCEPAEELQRNRPQTEEVIR